MSTPRKKIDRRIPLTYVLATATRGPDARNEGLFSTLKWEITARIRAMVFPLGQNHETGAWRNDIFDQTSLDNIRTDYKNIDIDGELDCGQFDCLQHYTDHLIEAVHETRNHEMWGNPDLALQLIALLEKIRSDTTLVMK